MRRFTVTCVLGMLAAMPAACTGQSKPAPWDSPDSVAATGASTPDVCVRIRTAIAKDMDPIGEAMGTMIGYGVANDSDDHKTAAAKVTDAVKAMGHDIAAAAADAADEKLKTAVTTTVSNINALADDPSFVSDITSLDDIQDASQRLTEATKPVATACAA